MKKIISLFGASFCIAANAGLMGPVVEKSQNTSTPYMAIEAAYTWADVNGVYFNNNQPSITRQPWGGRLSAGILRPYTDHLSFNAEFGGGYYHSSKNSLRPIGFSSKNSINGFDLLVGMYYRVNQFNIFGQIGGMLENHVYKVPQNYDTDVPGGLLSGSTLSRYNLSEMLPEIKVGGIYGVNDTLGLSLAYMHVFGVSTHGTEVFTATPSLITRNGVFDKRNPSLDSIMLGLHYNFV